MLRDTRLVIEGSTIVALGLGSKIGTIAPGFEADIIATEGNLLDDITAVRRVVFVMKGGRVYRNGKT